MDALRNENAELRTSFLTANRRAFALQAQAATLEARLAFVQNNRRAPVPITGVEYNIHTIKGRLRGVKAELTIKDDELRSDLGTLRELQGDADFLGLCQEGTTIGAAFDSIGRVHERFKSCTGVTECGICYEPITGDTVMLGKNCHHLFCAGCVESYMESPTAEGVGNMRCPFRCAGTFSDRAHWTLFQQAKAEVESEGDSVQIAADVLETPDEKFQSMIEKGGLLVVPFTGPDGAAWEEVKEGPRMTNRKRALDEDPTLVKGTLFLFKDLLKKITMPFGWAQLGGGAKQVASSDELAKESGCAKGWVRRVVAAAEA